MLSVLLATVTATVTSDSFAVPTLRDAEPSLLQFRLAVGTEWDTNARRAIGNASSPVVGDGVARLIAELGSTLQPHPAHDISLGYLLGAKRFFAQASEDLLVHNLNASSEHRLSSLFSASTFGALRASRIRSGARDYSLGVAGGSFAVRPISAFAATLLGSYVGFDFVPDDNLSYAGPIAGIDLAYSLGSDFFTGARAQYAWRAYPGTRDDTETLLSGRFAYRGKLRAALDYTVRMQRSTSERENITRHRVSAIAAFSLFWEMTANVSAALQRNQGESASDPLLLAEDDENQSYVQIGLSRKIGEALAVELRYALFAIQFTTSQEGFTRQTFYGGISYRLGD